MSNEVKGKKKVAKTNSYESLKAMFYSGKVKPALNKIIVELESSPENLDFVLLACQCLLKGKSYEELANFADRAIAIDDQNKFGFYFKGVALQNSKGKEQEALKNLNSSLEIDPDFARCLLSKANAHLMLYTDYHLPVKFAEKHRDKGEESLLKLISIVEAKEAPDYRELLALAEANILITRNIEAKKYYQKAVNAFEASSEEEQDKNVYKEIIKAQKACIKLIEKFTE